MPDKNAEISADYPLIDIHCHRYSHANHAQILSLDVHEVATSEFDSSEPLLINPLTGARYISIGIHPWHIGKQNPASTLEILKTFTTRPNFLAIGECGLDKCIDTAMTLQIDVFSQHIALAERLGKPLIVHCVRAFSELLQLKKELKPKQPWIIHGFTGKPGLAAQLIKHGCYLSLGAALLSLKSYAGQTLQSIPANRFFLETDTVDQPISQIYAAAARIRGDDIAGLRQQIFTNFLNVFFND